MRPSESKVDFSYGQLPHPVRTVQIGLLFTNFSPEPGWKNKPDQLQEARSNSFIMSNLQGFFPAKSGPFRLLLADPISGPRLGSACGGH